LFDIVQLQYHFRVQLLLLTARPELETNRRLERAAHAQGATVLTVDAARLAAFAGSTHALLKGLENLLELPTNAALARVGNWRPDSVLAALEAVVAGGVRTPNPPDAIRIGRDHWRTAHTLALSGLPVPTTVAGGDPEELAAAASSSLDFPVVVKQRRSRKGVGVIKCSSLDQLESVLDSLWRVGDEVIVQRFVPTGGASLRLLVVGDDVVAAARFEAQSGDWRSNAARGGSVRRHQPSSHEVDLARAAAKAIGLGVCGVDLFPGDSTVIGEVNPTPGFVRLEAATGVDVAAAIVGFTLRGAAP
jgi:RimK family alpha-L-glutamate ligase